MCKSIVNEMLENLLEGRKEWKKELAMMTKEESEKAVEEITEAFKNNLVKEINNMGISDLFEVEDVIVKSRKKLEKVNQQEEAYGKGDKSIQEIFNEKHTLPKVTGAKHSIRNTQITKRSILADICQEEQESDEYLKAVRQQVKSHDEKGYDYHISNSILY